MNATATTAYPVRDAGEGDRRFSRKLVAEVAAVLEMHGYPPVNDLGDVADLQDALFKFICVERGDLGSLQARLQNDASVPADWTPGALCSEDCGASAHELRDVKGAEGAVVIAMDRRGTIFVGTAVDEDSKMDRISVALLASLQVIVSPEVTLKDRTFVVSEAGDSTCQR